jgi:fibronectin-binding autotransporter adhesin
MNTITQLAGRGVGLLVLILCVTAMVFSQNIVITDSASFTGGGTINIKGHIIDSATTNKTITGTTRLVGSAQDIGQGGAATVSLTFDTLTTAASGNKNLMVPVTVAGRLGLDSGTVILGGKVLNIDGSAAKVAGALTANGASDTVQYRGTSGTQSIVDATYNVLNLKNTVPINLLNPVTAAVVDHSGSGGLTVNKRFTVNTSAALNTIADATDTLVINGTGANSIAAVSTTSPTGEINNASTGALTITAVTANSGVISTNNGALNIPTLTANSGIVKTAGAGGISITNPAVNNGIITDSTGTGAITFAGSLINNSGGRVTSGNGGSLAFSSITNGGTVSVAGTGTSNFASGVNNSGGTIALSGGSATFNANFIAPGTLSFDSSSHVTYTGTADTIESTTYGSLVLNNTPTKAARGSFTVADSLRLGSTKLNMAANVLTMSSWKGNNVVNDSLGEVIGRVRRSNVINPDTYYAFNKDSVGLSVDATIASGDLTINMVPGDTFATPSPSTKYVKRYFGFNGTVGSANLKTLSLVYAQSEVEPTVSNEARLGIRKDISGAWSKVTNPSGYSRNVNPASNVVTLSGLVSPLAGVSEFGIMSSAFITVADNHQWNATGTWDEGTAPTPDDDAEVNNTGITMGANPGTAASVVINTGKSLTVDNNLTIGSTLDNFGTLSVAGGDSLTLASLNHSSSIALANAGTITMSGKFRVHGPVNNTGVINVGQ